MYIPEAHRGCGTRLLAVALLFAPSLPLCGCRGAAASIPAPARTDVTTIRIGPEPLRTGVKRLGINLGGQSFYDSGQMLRNLTFRNPGFEGGTWQSILHCKTATLTACTDENQYAVWPAGFLDGASLQALSGSAQGQAGHVLHSTAAEGNQGVTLNFEGLHGLKAGDFVLVRLDKPGQAEAGWWTSVGGGARLLTEFKDLAPGTAGRQCLRVEAAEPGQFATVSSYFDSLEGHSFVQLRGSYTLRFRARGLGNAAAVDLKLERLDTAHGVHSFFARTVRLAPQWQDYRFDFNANEAPSALGTVGLTFRFAQSSALLDDVSLTEAAAPDNPTPFRNAVVQTLRDLHPGVLRYMDSGSNFGSSLNNMLAPPMGRQRTGASTQEILHEDIPLGLHEFLVLAQATGAEPWYSMPPGTSPAEAAELVEYLAGRSDTPYGKWRAALGQAAPWTSVFPVIHLELGNEQWNARSFAGSALNDPTAYAQRATAVFAAARSAPAFRAASFDLILGSWATVPWWTGQELASASGVDSVAVAPYLFTEFNDSTSAEAIFGPMLAQPQLIDSPSGYMGQQRNAARKAARSLSVYEVNLGTMSGTAPQQQLDRAIPSLGAGLAVTEHMLLMLRDLGVTVQCLFSLPEYVNNFPALNGHTRRIPLWGAVVDMGGATNLRRPQFLAGQLANLAILPTLLATHLSGADPAWSQPKSLNDSIALAHAQMLQTFAFTDGQQHSLLLLNLSRDSALTVTFTGAIQPAGDVTERILNSPAIDDTNEQEPRVTIQTRHLLHFDGSATYRLPPHSMTVLTW